LGNDGQWSHPGRDGTSFRHVARPQFLQLLNVVLYFRYCIGADNNLGFLLWGSQIGCAFIACTSEHVKTLGADTGLGAGMSVTRAVFALVLLFGLGGCGARVPELRDWPNNNEAGAATMVEAIVRSVRCELRNAVTVIVNQDIEAARHRVSHRTYTDFLNNWGAEVAFTFTIVEKTVVNPAGVWMPPSPATAIFTLGGDVSVSGQATRVETMNIFYTVKELYLPPGQTCDASGEDPSGSFLIRNDLKLAELLEFRLFAAETGNASTPNSGDKNVLSHQVTFQVVTGGGLTPTWQLTRGTINGSGTFLSGSRDRTHDLVITFGPIDRARGGKSLIAIAEQAHATSQLTGGFATRLKPALSR
jgi:hypothetical protein